MRLLTLLLSITLLFRAEANGISDKARAIQEVGICEIVFRLQMRPGTYSSDWKIKEEDKIKVYFLQVKRKDPANSLLAKFTRHTPPVKKYSQSYVDRHSYVRDKATQRRGVRYQVDTIKWMSKWKVSVTGGYYSNGLSAAGQEYMLVKRGGHWRVVRHRALWRA